MVTGNEVKTAVLAAGLTRIPHHECGICDVMVGYAVRGEELYFDSGCGCSGGSNLRHCGWDDAANWINMQTNEKARADLMARFKLT